LRSLPRRLLPRQPPPRLISFGELHVDRQTSHPSSIPPPIANDVLVKLLVQPARFRLGLSSGCCEDGGDAFSHRRGCAGCGWEASCVSRRCRKPGLVSRASPLVVCAGKTSDDYLRLLPLLLLPHLTSLYYRSPLFSFVFIIDSATNPFFLQPPFFQSSPHQMPSSSSSTLITPSSSHGAFPRSSQSPSQSPHGPNNLFPPDPVSNASSPRSTKLSSPEPPPSRHRSTNDSPELQRGRTVSALTTSYENRSPVQETLKPEPTSKPRSKRLSFLSYLPSSSSTSSRDKEKEKETSSPSTTSSSMSPTSPTAVSPSIRSSPSTPGHGHSNSLSSFLSPSNSQDTQRNEPIQQTRPNSMLVSQPSSASNGSSSQHFYQHQPTQHQHHHQTNHSNQTHHSKSAQSFVPTVGDPAALRRSRTLARQMLGPSAAQTRAQQPSPPSSSSHPHQNPNIRQQSPPCGPPQHAPSYRARSRSPEPRSERLASYPEVSKTGHEERKNGRTGEPYQQQQQHQPVYQQGIVPTVAEGRGGKPVGVVEHVRTRSVSTPLLFASSSGKEQGGSVVKGKEALRGVRGEKEEMESFTSQEVEEGGGGRKRRRILIDGRMFEFDETGDSLHLVRGGGEGTSTSLKLCAAKLSFRFASTADAAFHLLGSSHRPYASRSAYFYQFHLRAYAHVFFHAHRSNADAFCHSTEAAGLDGDDTEISLLCSSSYCKFGVRSSPRRSSHHIDVRPTHHSHASPFTRYPFVPPNFPHRFQPLPLAYSQSCQTQRWHRKRCRWRRSTTLRLQLLRRHPFPTIRSPQRRQPSSPLRAPRSVPTGPFPTDHQRFLLGPFPHLFRPSCTPTNSGCDERASAG
jgi:hypothetical protein